MEELVLTDPIVIPEQTTASYKVIALTLDWAVVVDMVTGQTGMVRIDLKDNLGEKLTHYYHGQVALDMMKWMNTANFSVNSMHKRILQKLTQDGVLVGTVEGAPEPPVVEE